MDSNYTDIFIIFKLQLGNFLSTQKLFFIYGIYPNLYYHDLSKRISLKLIFQSTVHTRIKHQPAFTLPKNSHNDSHLFSLNPFFFVPLIHNKG